MNMLCSSIYKYTYIFLFSYLHTPDHVQVHMRCVVCRVCVCVCVCVYACVSLISSLTWGTEIKDEPKGQRTFSTISSVNSNSAALKSLLAPRKVLPDVAVSKSYPSDRGRSSRRKIRLLLDGQWLRSLDLLCGYLLSHGKGPEAFRKLDLFTDLHLLFQFLGSHPSVTCAVLWGCRTTFLQFRIFRTLPTCLHVSTQVMRLR